MVNQSRFLSPTTLRRLALGAAALTATMAAGLAGTLVAAAPAAADAPVAQAAPANPPKLLVAIAVDQYSADLFAQYRQHYTGGLARLLSGAVFPSAYQSHSATETCPGHSTILTGVHPSRSGIIANNWYDFTIARADKRVYCSEEESDPNSSSSLPVVSAHHLRVPTLGERMKQAFPGSRNVAVSAKDRAVMMMGGHDIDEAYWWQARGFSSLNGRTLADAAFAENTTILAELRKGAPGLPVPAWCRPMARAIAAHPVASDFGPPPPLVVGVGNFPLTVDDADSYRVSPRVDAATLDLAAALVADMKLGKGAVPDMLSISLSATDYIGHAYGTEGQEMCVQMHEMDQSLGTFFARLDKLGIDYAVVLTADHGGLDLPERLDEQAAPDAARASKALTAQALSDEITARLGLPAGTPKLVYAESAFGDYYVPRDLPADTRARVLATLEALLKASPQVEAVWTKAEIAASPMPHGGPQEWTLLQRARASFDAERSGDVFSVLKRTVVPIPEARPGYTATHGSPWDYDRRVPLLFWRRGLTGFEQPQPVETVDIAPTLAALIGLPVPAGAFDGRCLDIDGGPADTCAVKAVQP